MTLSLGLLAIAPRITESELGELEVVTFECETQRVEIALDGVGEPSRSGRFDHHVFAGRGDGQLDLPVVGVDRDRCSVERGPKDLDVARGGPLGIGGREDVALGTVGRACFGDDRRRSRKERRGVSGGLRGGVEVGDRGKVRRLLIDRCRVFLDHQRHLERAERFVEIDHWFDPRLE